MKKPKSDNYVKMTWKVDRKNKKELFKTFSSIINSITQYNSMDKISITIDYSGDV